MSDDNIDATPEGNPPTKKSMLGKIAIGLFVVGVIATESIVAHLLIPSPDAMAEKIKATVARELEDEEAGSILEEAELGPVSEVEIGDFNITIYDHVSESTLNVNCRLMATVSNKDLSEFESLLKNNQNRLREKIMFEFRSADINHLTDPGLDLIKRRILGKSNKLLGKPIIKSVVFSEYNYYQQ